MWVVASSGFSWMPAALHSFSVEGNCEFPKLKVGMAADELAGRTGTLSLKSRRFQQLTFWNASKQRRKEVSDLSK